MLAARGTCVQPLTGPLDGVALDLVQELLELLWRHADELESFSASLLSPSPPA